jgi:hypothetical protein
MGEQIREGNGFLSLKGHPQYIVVQVFEQKVAYTAEPVEKGIEIHI